MGTCCAAVVGVALAVVASPGPPILPPSQARAVTNLIITVLDPLGQPAADVPLLIENGPFQPPFVMQAQTDQNGRFRLRLPAGTYSLSAPIDFFPATQIRIPLGPTVEHTVRMQLDETIGTFSICLDCPESPSYSPSADMVDEFRSDRKAPLTTLVSGAEPEVGWEFFQPRAPDSLRQMGSSAPTGTVVVAGRIGVDGRVVDVHVVSAEHPVLASAATRTLNEERWRPATVRRKPVEVPFRLTLVFTREQK